MDLDGNRRRYKAGSVLAGGRADNKDAYYFLSDLRSRFAARTHPDHDRWSQPYLSVIEPLFGSDRVDFAMLHKIYGAGGAPDSADHVYSPPSAPE